MHRTNGLGFLSFERVISVGIGDGASEALMASNAEVFKIKKAFEIQ